ncbi:LysR family transcriptional regulator [Undibacterium crateris]|uniref:LysR family transcriptional regulator n=1 Tax=Undibacterium crateris TaxID=2528175 RepID=UPI002E28807D|nr:LysR family transcriptional regulator [Undibacterium crateris]
MDIIVPFSEQYWSKRMQIEANDLFLFARVTEEGSFSKAAERLGLPKSTLSRRISTLETQLGERLLLRTTRQLSLTEFGHSVLQHALQVREEVEATLALTQHRQAEPSGNLRISMPGDFAYGPMGIFLGDLLRRYPSIQLDMDLSPRRVDLIAENFDVAIRVGELPDDASLAARRLTTFKAGLYAAPSYLAKRGTPSEPEALMEHDALRLTARNKDAIPWRLRRGNAQWEGIPPGRATANSPEILIRLAVQGMGIMLMSHHFARNYLETQALVPILGDWQGPEIPVWAVFPGRRLMPARTRVFLDALVERYQNELPDSIAARDCS